MSTTSSRLRAGALSSVLVVLGAAPAGAVGQGNGLGPGCERSGGGRVTCTYSSPTNSPLRVDVPHGVHRAVITVRGGAGGPGAIQTPVPVPGLSSSPGGAAGTATAAFALDPREDLDVRVGGAGQPGIEGGGGGLGGGGNGNTLIFLNLGLAGGGGGGGSEVRVTRSNPSGADPLIAAGGGGGGGSGVLLGLSQVQLGPGGAGGGPAGTSSTDLAGDGFGSGRAGTPTAGGGGGGPAVPGLPPVMGGTGVRGQGGDAGMAAVPKMFEDGIGGGGGGGGGFFGGAAGSLFAGGGGGSGFGPPGTRYGISDARDGAVVIVFDPPVQDGTAHEMHSSEKAARER